MPTDVREQLTQAAGRPVHGPDVEGAMRRGSWLRRRRRIGIGLATVAAVVVVVGPATRNVDRMRPSQIPPIGDVETTSSLAAPIVHDAWIEVREGSLHREGDDGSPDEARSDLHVWDEQEQAWVGPEQWLQLHVEVPEGAEGFVVEDADGLLMSTFMRTGPGAWVTEVPLQVYDDQIEQTADELVVTLRTVSVGGDEHSGPSPMPSWPDITATSEPVRVANVRPARPDPLPREPSPQGRGSGSPG